MSKYDELKRLAEAANAIVGDVDFHFTIARAGGCDQAEVDAVAAFLGKANPHAILELITENERLAATNEQITAALYDQIEITHQHRLESDGLKAERDQMRELLMRLVDLQNSGRGPIRSYELWNDVVNEARPLLGLEVRHV